MRTIRRIDRVEALACTGDNGVEPPLWFSSERSVAATGFAAAGCLIAAFSISSNRPLDEIQDPAEGFFEVFRRMLVVAGRNHDFLWVYNHSEAGERREQSREAPSSFV